MTKSVPAILCLLFCSLMGFAQQQSFKPWGALDAGLLTGSSGPALDVRLQGGVAKKGWKWGIGGGYDAYRFASVPLYAQARKYLGTGGSRLILLGSLGASIPAVQPPSQGVIFDDIWYSPVREQRYHTGLYAEAGAGVSFFAKKKLGLELTLLYNRKTMKETFIQQVYNGSDGNEEAENWNKYRMNRLVLRLGVRI